MVTCVAVRGVRSLRSWAIRTGSRRVEMPSFRSMDRTWLVAVLTATVSSSAISPLSRVGGARARRASARSTVPESPSARCGARRRAAARTVCRPAGDEERRSSPVKPTASAKVERRRTNDADGLAKSERVGHRHPTRFRVVGLERGLGLDEVHLDLGVGISAPTIGFRRSHPS